MNDHIGLEPNASSTVNHQGFSAHSRVFGEGFVLVPCTVFVNHRHSRRLGKFVVTVARPGGGTPNVREFAADAEPSYLLLDLGYTQSEVEHILKELERKKASIQHTRSIDEFTLNDNGF